MLAFMCASAEKQAHEKASRCAILMVHCGTTFDDTRAVTIDALNVRVREAFPDFTVAEAYTSRIIIDRLKKRGIEKHTPVEALLRLAADGYDTVIVQGTNIIDGIETEVLRREADMMKPFFKDIRVGRPLLYSVEDGEKTVGILPMKRHLRSSRFPERGKWHSCLSCLWLATMRATISPASGRRILRRPVSRLQL